MTIERFTFNDLDPPELRLVVEGEIDGEPTLRVEIELENGWVAHHQIEPQTGVWMVSAALSFEAPAGSTRPLTERLKRKATIHQHLPRIERLLDEAFDLDRALNKDPSMRLAADEKLGEEQMPWWNQLAVRWKISRLRSRRGRLPKIDPTEVERLVSEGHTYRQIGERMGVHRKSVARAMSKYQQRMR